MPRRVVITGLGVVTALGDSLEPFWAGLLEGRSGVSNLTLFDTTHFKVHFGGQVHDWESTGAGALPGRLAFWLEFRISFPDCPQRSSKRTTLPVFTRLRLDSCFICCLPSLAYVRQLLRRR